MMFEKLARKKVFRDPLYGYIEVEYRLIAELIDSKEFQRLRRIRQLSGVSMVFQTAEHSRFTHSLGAYHMACLVLKNVEGIEVLSDYEQLVFLTSALLHDVGHGPYSHAFENVLATSHENMTVKIIQSEITQINRILKSYGDDLADDVAGIISHSGKYKLIETLVSSQLDVDRIDYLSRDAYYTGATYGFIDMHRLLRSMKIVDGQLLCRASGICSIESYLMSRYHMYFQVYYHPVALSYELILESIYQRIKDLIEANCDVEANIKSFINVVKDNDDIKSYIELDDAYVNGFIKQLTTSCDCVLNKLANDFIDRHLFSYVQLSSDEDLKQVENIKNKLKKDPYGCYYYYETQVSQVAYLQSDATSFSDINIIKVLLPNGEVQKLDQYSKIISGLISTSQKTIKRIFYNET